MRSIRKDMKEFQGHLEKGALQIAYRALLSYMADLRKHFMNRYPESSVSALYQGYMDMTYFAISPPSLKQRDLKIAIVFNYETFGFEAWLAGRNRKVNQQYWELFRGSKWPDYRIITPGKGVDSIVECDLAEYFDFGDPDTLTASIDAATASHHSTQESYLEALAQRFGEEAPVNRLE